MGFSDVAALYLCGGGESGEDGVGECELGGVGGAAWVGSVLEAWGGVVWGDVGWIGVGDT